MVRRTPFRQADIARALKGVADAGLKPSGCRVDPTTGAIEIMFGSEATSNSANSFDAILLARR